MTRNEQQRIAFVEHKSVVARNMKDLLCKSKDDVAFWNKDCYKAFYSKENKKKLLQVGLEQLKAAKAYNEVSSIYKKFLDTIYKEHDKVFIEIATEYAVSVKNEEATARKFYNSMVSSDKSARELFAETSTKYIYRLQLPNGLIAKVDLRDEAKINSITKKSRRNYNETNDKVYLLTVEYQEGPFDIDRFSKVYAKRQDAIDELNKLIRVQKVEYGDDFDEDGNFIGEGGIWCCEEDETSFSIWEDENYSNSHFTAYVSEEIVF